MITTNGVVVYAVLCALSTARLAISSFNAEGRIILDYVDPPSGFDHVGSSVAIKAENLGQNMHDDHDDIPPGLAARKDIMESMMTGRNEIGHGIDALKPKLKTGMLESKTKKEFSKVLFELEQLYCALREPTVDKLRRLGGLDPSPNCFFVQENPLPHAPLTSQADLLQPAQADRKGSGSIKSLKDSKYFKKAFIWNKLSSYVNHFGIQTGKNSPSSSSEPLLKHSDSLGSTTKRTDEHRLSPKNLVSDRVKKPARIPTVLEALLIEKRITTGDLGTPQDMMSGASDGDELRLGKGLTNEQKIGTWNSLQDKLIKMQSRDKVPDATEAKFLLQFVESIYLLGDHILRYRLLPSIDSLEIAKPDTVVKMIQFHTELLFRHLGESFYEAPESVVPELEFLRLGRAAKHFHMSVQALPTEAQGQVVHAVLRTILSHTPVDFHGGIPSEKFDEIRKTFLHDEFLERVHRLSSEIIKKPDADLREEKDNMTMVLFMGRLMRFFREPEMKTPPKQKKIEYQLVYYILNFFDAYHPPILKAMLDMWEKRLPQSQQMQNTFLLQDELEFMRVYLATYRNSNDRTYPQTELQIMPFVSMFMDDRNRYSQFHRWVKIFFVEIFDHHDWHESNFINRYQRFNIWMDKI
ncbi:hypothetical protein MJO28_015036 [Puccinia striiformis f. sp. tritici]|uniref:Uncharacterized protein n=1 Tax=Puccinia striiformis f. sp. tritici TaxID=168172 RepID=A0ACC0DS24_9BASI|nr:hypothetical protein MJO28_015036 [Puccinia striiformis f. sp. tritici]